MAHQTLINSLQQIKLNPTAMRFFGKSSSIMFVQTAMDLKREYSGKPPPERRENPVPALLEGARRKAFRSLHPVRPSSPSSRATINGLTLTCVMDRTFSCSPRSSRSCRARTSSLTSRRTA